MLEQGGIHFITLTLKGSSKTDHVKDSDPIKLQGKVQ